MKLLELVSCVVLGAASCVACGATTSNDDGMGGTGGAGGDGGSADAPGGAGGSAGTSIGSGGVGGTPNDTGGTGGDGIVSVPPPACDEGDEVGLAPGETAERLARLFWHQAAPQSLLEAAEDDGLKTTGAVACFAREMLEDARAEAGIADFFEGWLEIGKFAESQQDPEYVPKFTPEIVEVAQVEAVRFAVEVWRSPNGTLAELLLSSHASVSEELAPFYGSGDATGWLDFGEERSGILTQLYFLMTRTSRAHGSPTQRGSDMAQMLACLPIPQPPASVEADFVPIEFEGTTRQWYEETHATMAVCIGCHTTMDSAGFVFEHFDVMGRYRTDEAGLPIDATGRLPLADLSEPVVIGHAAAMQALSESGQVRRCFALHFYAYALGSLRSERAYAASLEGQEDADVIDYLAARASAEKDFGLTELFLAAVETEAFLAP